MSNSTCPVERAPVDPVPFYTNGNITFKAHDVGWIICGFFSLIATTASFWLVWKHLTYYTCPQQQRHIVRMLFMVPIYAIVSTLSYVFYHEAIYYQTIRDCYEAVVITSFFNLLLQYVGDTPAEQHEVFRQVKLKKWFFPLGFWKYRPSGLHFLWLMKICILQYAIVRPVCTLAAVGLQYFGLYCLESWEPVFGHIWISVTISISVTVAMYCVIQFYMPISEELKPYDPVLKFLAVKTVVFLTFWQDSFLSILVYFGAIKQSKYMTAGDIQVGINALLESFWMVVFGFVHIKAFTYLIYRPQDRARTTRRGRALLDVLDFRDWWYDMKQSTRYVAARSRGKDYTIVDDIRREKYQHLEKALGRERWDHMQAEREVEKSKMPTFWKDGGQGEAAVVEEADVEKASTAAEEEGKPRGNMAMRADYDPEMDNDGDLDAAPLMADSEKEVTSAPARPTLPSLSYNLGNVANPQRDVHPELTQYHRTAADALEADEGDIVGADEEDDIYIPRKGGKARKEASLGLGAWWRTFRERVSGHGGGEERDGENEEGDNDEKRVMLADELGRGIALMKAEREREDDGELMPPIRKGTHDSTDSSDVSASVLQSRDSPLSLLIHEHRSENRGRKPEGEERDRAPPKIVPSSREKQVAVIQEHELMARQGSTRAALDVQANALPCEERIGRVEMMGRAMGLKAPQLATSVVPSISAAQSSAAFSAAPSTTRSTAELQRERTQAGQTSGSMRGVGPKGKPIALVLPTPLSPNDFRSPAPFSPQVVAVGPTPSVPRQTSSSKIRFAETKPPPRPRDDPEAEPVQVHGTVVVGGQSLSQVNALKRQREEEQRRVREAEQRRAQEARRQGMRAGQETQDRGHRPRSGEPRRSQADLPSERRTGQARQPGEQGRRSRRTSEPPVPTQADGTRNRSGLFGRKERSPEPYISLPAPSQLAQMDNRQDPFAAAVSASSPASNSAPSSAPTPNFAGRGSYQQQHRRSTVDGAASSPSLQVGSVLFRQDIINAAVAPTHRHRRPSEPLNHAAPQQHAPAWPLQPAHYQNSRPVRHSIGGAPRPAAVASYNRYSGEPAWVNDRQAQSRVETRRRQYEAPQGFHFDYID